MKFCPHCGASLPDSAASLFPDSEPFICPFAKQSKESVRDESDPAHNNKERRQSRPPPTKRRPSKSRIDTILNTLRKPVPPQPPMRNAPESRKPDEGYDGYYDDILPTDNGRERDELDPELIKRIILVVAGAFAVIVLALLLMYLL